MKLLNLDTIRDKLDVKFRNSFAMYPDIFSVFIPSLPIHEQSNQVEDVVKSEFGMKLHVSYLEILQIWNLGKLDICGFEFGRADNYAEQLFNMNNSTNSPGWWEDKDVYLRPSSKLMIAQSDPYIAILDNNSGEILTFIDVDGSSSMSVSAKNISTFMKGLGSVELLSYRYVESHSIDEWAAYILKTVGGQNSSYSFWKYLVMQALERD